MRHQDGNRSGNQWGVRLIAVAVLTVLTMGLLTVPNGTPPTYAVGTLDQQQTSQNSFALLNSGSGYAQTFTAGITGDLDQVDLAIAKVPGVDSTLSIQIMSVVGGVPSTPILSTTTVSTTLLSTFLGSPVTIISIPLSTTVPVISGTQYAVAVRAGTGATALGGINLSDTYASGQYFVEIPANTFGGVPSADAYFRTYVTPPATATPTVTLTPTSTVTSTPTVTPTGTLTPSVTPTVTATVTPVVVNDPNNDDEKPKQTEEQRQQQQHTNRGNRDDVYTEGNVIEVHQDVTPPYIVLANRDGPVIVRLLCGSDCPTIRVGDYVEAEGEKQHEQLFDASDVSVSRSGR